MTEQDGDPGPGESRKRLGGWDILVRVLLVLIGGFVLFVALILGTCFLK